LVQLGKAEETRNVRYNN